MAVTFVVETDELEAAITHLKNWEDSLQSVGDADEAIRTGERAQEMLEEFITDLKKTLDH